MSKAAQPVKSSTFTKRTGIPRRFWPQLRETGIIKDVQQGGYPGDNLHHDKIVIYDREKLKKLGRLSIREPDFQETIDPMQIVSPLPLICTKCGKLTIVVNKVKRKGKDGRIRTYIEWRHWDNRKRSSKGKKKGGYVHHYKRYFTPEEVSESKPYPGKQGYGPKGKKRGD